MRFFRNWSFGDPTNTVGNLQELQTQLQTVRNTRDTSILKNTSFTFAVPLLRSGITLEL